MNLARARWLLVSGMLMACTSGSLSEEVEDDPPIVDSPAARSSASQGAPSSKTLLAGASRTYPSTNAFILNPERGFWDYEGASLDGVVSSVAKARTNQHSVSYVSIRLDNYKTGKNLDATFLANLQAYFDALRTNGVKTAINFTYNFPNEFPGADDQDASLATITKHIDQLTPLFTANSDVIMIVHAGFMGKWGEFHDSTNGLDTKTNKNAILSKLLAAVPANRLVASRYPADKAELIGSTTALTAATAYNGSTGARLAHYNLCFLADTDYKTGSSYANRTSGFNLSVDQWRSFAMADTLYTSEGGETCELTSDPTHTDCGNALFEMGRFHWSYIDSVYFPDTIAKWKAQGCWDYSTTYGLGINERLGYRLRIKTATFPDAIVAGTSLPVTIELTNDGFANFVNHRSMKAVLKNVTTGATYTATFDGDLRRNAFAAATTGATSTFYNATITLPLTAAAGTYKLSLNLPDDAASLATDPRYSVQLANAGIWDATTGMNTLSSNVAVSAAPPIYLSNFSVRSYIDPYTHNATLGMISSSSATNKKSAVFRAIGPSLAAQGVSPVVDNPKLEIHAANGTLVGSNDNYGTAGQSLLYVPGSFDLRPTNALEAAMGFTLAAPTYTVIGKRSPAPNSDGQDGVILLEAYDLGTTSTNRFLNGSIRGFVKTTNPMVGGLIFTGTGTKKLVARAFKLDSDSTHTSKADVKITLYDVNGKSLASNSTWGTSKDAAFLTSNGLGLPSSTDAAVVYTLGAGLYTFVVETEKTGTLPAVDGGAMGDFYLLDP